MQQRVITAKGTHLPEEKRGYPTYRELATNRPEALVEIHAILQLLAGRGGGHEPRIIDLDNAVEATTWLMMVEELGGRAGIRTILQQLDVVADRAGRASPG